MATSAILLVVTIVNYLVDPYRLHGIGETRPSAWVKPRAGANGAAAKAYLLRRAAPNALILGNSRAEVGFDPAAEAWPQSARPVFSLSLPGTGTKTTLRYLEYALAQSREQGAKVPELIIWGLDFVDFLPVETAQYGPTRPHGPSNPEADHGALPTSKDYVLSLLTFSALLDSVVTVAAQTDPQAADLTRLGFNPMRDYERLASQEGYRSLFAQKNASYVARLEDRAAVAPRPAVELSESFEDMRQVLHLCAQHGITLKIVLYPYHAHFLETIRLTGMLAYFEDWKRAVAKTAHQQSAAIATPVPVWDFARYSDWTTEPVPEWGDKRSVVQGYWEAGHFKKALGDEVLAKVLAPSAQLGSSRFALLTPHTLDADLQQDRTRGEAYRQQHPAEIDSLLRLVQAQQCRNARPPAGVKCPMD